MTKKKESNMLEKLANGRSFQKLISQRSDDAAMLMQGSNSND